MFIEEIIHEKKSLCGNGTLLGPYIFDGNVNGYNCLQLMNNFTFLQLQEHVNNQFDGIFRRLWWFQDGAPAHCLKAVRHMFHEMFANLFVALYHEVEWPPRSSDMTLCDFFLWGYSKSQFFVTSPRDMQDLRNRIQVEVKIPRQNPSVIRSAVRIMEKGHGFVLKNMTSMLNKNLRNQFPIGVYRNSCFTNM